MPKRRIPIRGRLPETMSPALNRAGTVTITITWSEAGRGDKAVTLVSGITD